MKRIFLAVLALCTAFGASAKSSRNLYRVTTEGTVKDCPVVIADVPAWAAGATVYADGTEIPSQLDRELNELAFVADIEGERTFRIVWSSEPVAKEYPARVHAQMWWKNPDKSLKACDVLSSEKDDMYQKLHHHGPAFESEKAAYRVYFDKKQSIDTYGKKQQRLELAESMWYPSDEQLAAGFGHDNLRVFGSISVGVLKGWDAEARKMVHITDMSRREARIVAHGPVRTVVDMRVEGWRYCGRELTMTSRYILYAGHGDVQVENRIEGDTEGLLFTTGVMKIAEHEVDKSMAGEGVLMTWGTDYPENDKTKWEPETVGLVVAVPAGRIVSQIDDGTSYLFQVTPDAGGRIDYGFEMIWRKSTWLDFGHKGFFDLMKESVAGMRRPVEVKRLK